MEPESLASSPVDLPPRLTFDAHLDLAMNAMEWNRDLTRPIQELRQREHGLGDKPDRGRGTVCFSEMRRGAVSLCVTSLIARYTKPGNPWAQTQGQMAWYRAMEQAGQMVQINETTGLQQHLQLWQSWLARTQGKSKTCQQNAADSLRDDPPIGYVLSLEGADSLISMHHLERAYAQGLRAIGPAHYGPGTYAQGTDASGGVGPKGRELLQQMQLLGIILDVTHLCDESFWEAVHVFPGPVWASHSNCRALVPHSRQLSDEQIRCLLTRGAIIGVALDAWMLVPGWVRGQTTPQATGLRLERLVDHIDHICQIAGNTLNVGIGSDLDGGFGTEQTPLDLDTIADLAHLPLMLRARGYSDEDLDRIMHGNFVRFLKEAWPETGAAAVLQEPATGRAT
jgi:membrane dipeptidase